ncbi:MAG: hypothetical protein AAGC65_20280 [Mucilaginibacter sp.]|uniref:hypothetical protein n=1 Tax=Mucilaginibacter sp. TaxID=1882438 RepID=UPI0031B0D7DD
MEFNSIYGAIKIRNDYEKSVNFLRSLGKDQYYPFINTNMFAFGDYEVPYYYDDILISFGATYKGLGLNLIEWNFLVLKLEHILRNINFEIAQFHIESYMGDYTLTWICKDEIKDYQSDYYQLKKTDEWYFGYGRRSMFTGGLLEDLKPYDILEGDKEEDFKYPIVFDPLAVDFVRQCFNKTCHLPIGSAIDARLKFKDPLHDRVDEVLYSLVLAGKIHFAGNLDMEKIIIHEQPWFV